MQHFESQSGQFMRVAARLGTVMSLCWLAGCSSSPIPATQAAAPPPSVQTYFAPYVQGIAGSTTPLTYTLDDVVGADGTGAFSQTTYQPSTQPGPQVLNAGSLAIGQRGLRSLGITATYIYSSATVSYQVTPYSPPQMGSFAVELAGQAGGLVQMVGQPVQPLVAATLSCNRLGLANLDRSERRLPGLFELTCLKSCLGQEYEHRHIVRLICRIVRRTGD